MHVVQYFDSMLIDINKETIGVALITQLRTCVMEIVHIQGRSPNVVGDFPCHKELLLKKIIRSLWEFFFFRISYQF